MTHFFNVKVETTMPIVYNASSPCTENNSIIVFIQINNFFYVFLYTLIFHQNNKKCSYNKHVLPYTENKYLSTTSLHWPYHKLNRRFGASEMVSD